MANWRDTFKSKTSEVERKNRLAAEQQAQVQTQYAAINRLDITAANKQVTSQKLLDAIKSDGPAKYEALGIVKILINFKSNEKKGGDSDQAGTALADLERHAKVIQNLTAQELMEFVKNRSAFFQRQIPETFKQLLISILPSNINALVTAENGPFLISNGVINDQQLGAVVNRQIEEDHPPLEKIRTLFDLISRKLPYSPVLAQIISGAIVAGLKDGSRYGFWDNQESQKHLKNFLYSYISGSENPSNRQEDSRFLKAGLGVVQLPDKTNLQYARPIFGVEQTGAAAAGRLNVLNEFSALLRTYYNGSDKEQLLRWMNTSKKMIDARPFNFHDNSGEYGGTWAYQNEAIGNVTEKGYIRKGNYMRAYAASRKSADLSNGPQLTSQQGNINPGSINSFLTQSGFSMGMDESALVVFSQNQLLINSLAKSWSQETTYFANNTIDWDILTLLSEIDPAMYEKKRQGVGIGISRPETGRSDWALLSKFGGIQLDFARYKERVVKYKVDNHWIWKNEHRFYETIEADVRITWNFRTNYVHYEILNKINQLTLHPLVFPHNDPHLPKNTSTRYGF